MMHFALLLSAAVARQAGAAEPINYADNGWFRGWPPAEVTYSVASSLRENGRDLGDTDALTFHVGYIEDIRQTESLEWLLGVDWRRTQASVPDGVAVPNTLQSAAVVFGFDARVLDSFRVRLEVLPGIYSDFQDISGEDANAPLAFEASYSITPGLLIGAQLNVDTRRQSPLLGGVGVRWWIAEEWLLSLWLPRPQLEFSPVENVTLFAGASFSGGTYVVADHFGRALGRPELDKQAVDYREIRAGAGVRWNKARFAVELGGGWTVERRYDFHDRGVKFEAQGSPYARASFGATY